MSKENSTLAPSKVKLNEHPTVKRFRETQQAPAASARPTPLEANWLRQVCLEAGADDVGFVEIERSEIADQREDILAVFPPTRTLISYVLSLTGLYFTRHSRLVFTRHGRLMFTRHSRPMFTRGFASR